jgi:hypothetical protein
MKAHHIPDREQATQPTEKVSNQPKLDRLALRADRIAAGVEASYLMSLRNR